jgi:fatty-acyl-CoA synthase
MAAVWCCSPARSFDGRAMAQQLGRALPVYAVPIFVRIIKAQETTGTFKLRKVELKQQGFDPALIDEPLFVLLDRDHGYQPLTRAIHRRILAGTVRW